ncbi:capping protein-inhibiting regulator of actin dynamics isoform X2 [Pseudophryne corroboree]
MGTRAFSHDSIFIPDGQAEDEQGIQAVSQDYIVGKVKSLQQQLGKNIRFGQPPAASVKRMQDLGASTEEMETHSSPKEILEDIDMESEGSKSTESPISHSPRNVSGQERKADEKVTPVKLTRTKKLSGTIDSINLDAVPRSAPRLDNSAAKHKLAVKPKNQRKRHRGMSQEYNSVEVNEHETAINIQRSPDKTMYHPMEISTQDIIISDHFEHKDLELHSSATIQPSTPRRECTGKKNVEEKQQETTVPKHEEESRQVDEERKLEADKRRAQEEQRRKEIIKNIELERLQQKLREQKENEMKEQHRREEERRLRAEEILKELEEQRRQDEQRRREEQRNLQLQEEKKRNEMEKQKKALQIAEQQKALQIAYEKKRCDLELQKPLQVTEDQKRDNLEEEKALEIADEKKMDELVEQPVEELKQTTLIVQNVYELGENRTQEHSEDKLRNEDIKSTWGQKKSELQQQEISHKGEQVNHVSQHAVPSKPSSLDPECGFIEKDRLEEQILKEEIKEDEGELKQRQQRQDDLQQQERINEELRWQELDQRQRPFTFKVTSGEKQIIFEKVHLSPVTPLKEPATRTETQDPRENKANISSHTLPSSQCIPHTAILVTGAQLCGTAVNLSQIKDSACKSLLGLTEERKLDIMETRTEREKDNTKHISSKTKYTSESLDNESVLAELASIRSKILSKSENISVSESMRGGPRVSSDDWTAKGRGESHVSLRKTVSATAKFSITTAWQKFPETTKPTEVISDTSVKQLSKDNIATVLSDTETQDKPTERTMSVQDIVTNKMKKQVTIEDNTEGWIFSKDLPSFLVPCPPLSPRRGQLDRHSIMETSMNNSTRKSDKLLQNTEEKTTPFGIKLRRTNYSLRFNSETQNEQKRKKRYSAGDSFDGIPAPFMAADETELRTRPRKELSGSPSKMKIDSSVKVLVDTSTNASDNVHCTVVSPLIPNTHVSSPNKDRTVPKSPIMQKPSLAPKPSSSTPPSSPISRLSRTSVTDLHGQRMDINELDTGTVGQDIKVNSAWSSLHHVESLEHDMKDKTGFSSIPLREKTDKRPERIGKDRPILQSRHSLDGTRLVEKAESDQPLWITLALQKQKGFREQQASREERRQAREAKQADKLAKENACGVQAGEYRSRSGSLQKLVPQEEKKGDSVVTRLQRREQLQKSNTLPTSITVEITETVPVNLAKDLPKRFSTPDATSVSSEPAWLALAKRKSKAWSDCPQIIK